MSRVGEWLASAGLAAHAFPALAGLSDAAFCGLLMQVHEGDVEWRWRRGGRGRGWAGRGAGGGRRAARAGRLAPLLSRPFLSPLPPQDYAAHGVVDVDDKQRLYRLIKAVGEGGGGEGGGARSRSCPATRDPPVASPASHAVADVDDADSDGAGAAAAAAGAAAAPPPPPPPPPPPQEGGGERPPHPRESSRGETDVLDADEAAATVAVGEARTRVDLTREVATHEFRFDAVLDEAASDDAVYAATVAPLLPLLTGGGAGTVFAYGQTGSGKTHTMAPLPARAAGNALAELARLGAGGAGGGGGGDPAAGAHAAAAPPALSLWASVYEVYGGKIHDLLNGRARLEARENGAGRVVVAGLASVRVDAASAVADLAALAAAERATGATGANDASSRSHCVTEFTVRAAHAAAAAARGPVGRPRPAALGRPRVAPAPDPDAHPGGDTVVGKLSFIDLAGSERGADVAGADKETRAEGAAINKSLLALKECIRALDAGAGHVPFRGSKLTEVGRGQGVGAGREGRQRAPPTRPPPCVCQVLRDSFVGDRARTVMVATVSPGSGSTEHTLNTLRYADRVKELGRASGGGARGGGDGGSATAPGAAAAGRRRRLSMVGAAGATRAPAGPRRASAGGRASASGGAAAAPAPRPPPRRATDPPAPSALLAAEDALIAAHRASVEAAVAGVRAEVALLAAVDAPRARVGDYASRLASALAARDAAAAGVRAALGAYERVVAGGRGV